MRQKTLTQEVYFEGTGLHSGEESSIVIHPEKENTGIRFLIEGVYIPAHYTYVVNTNHSTDLGKDSKQVKTVEHLMAVFSLLGIDNATVEFLRGYEVPIMDGSGYRFYKELKDKVLELDEEKEVLRLGEVVEVSQNRSSLRAQPSHSFSAIYVGDIENFSSHVVVEYDGNVKDLVFARTFCYDYQVDMLRRMGLAKGGSLKNALVLGKGFVYNKEGMRSSDEPIRHKLFDLIGDLALLGKRLMAHVISHRGGHTLNHLLVRKIAQSETSKKVYLTRAG